MVCLSRSNRERIVSVKMDFRNIKKKKVKLRVNNSILFYQTLSLMVHGLVQLPTLLLWYNRELRWQ